MYPIKGPFAKSLSEKTRRAGKILSDQAGQFFTSMVMSMPLFQFVL